MINLFDIIYEDGHEERIKATFSAALWAEDRLAKQNMNIQTHRLRFLTLTAYKTLKDQGQVDKNLPEWIETVANISPCDEEDADSEESEGYSPFPV